MLGWRGRIGFVIHAPGIGSTHEMRELCPEGVLPIFATTPIGAATLEGNLKALGHFESGIQQLATAEVDVIVNVATMTSVALGADGEQQLFHRARAVTETTIVLAMRAAVEALRAIDVAKVAAVGPLRPEMMARAGEYLGAHGIEASLSTVGVSAPLAVHEFQPGAAYRFARQAVREFADSEAVLFIGGGWRTLEVIEALECDTGRPVLSTNQAAMWSALARMGIRPTDRRFGRLLNH